MLCKIIPTPKEIIDIYRINKGISGNLRDFIEKFNEAVINKPSDQVSFMIRDFRRHSFPEAFFQEIIEFAQRFGWKVLQNESKGPAYQLHDLGERQDTIFHLYVEPSIIGGYISTPAEVLKQEVEMPTSEVRKFIYQFNKIVDLGNAYSDGFILKEFCMHNISPNAEKEINELVGKYGWGVKVIERKGPPYQLHDLGERQDSIYYIEVIPLTRQPEKIPYDRPIPLPVELATEEIQVPNREVRRFVHRFEKIIELKSDENERFILREFWKFHMPAGILNEINEFAGSYGWKVEVIERKGEPYQLHDIGETQDSTFDLVVTPL